MSCTLYSWFLLRVLKLGLHSLICNFPSQAVDLNRTGVFLPLLSTERNAKNNMSSIRKMFLSVWQSQCSFLALIESRGPNILRPLNSMGSKGLILLRIALWVKHQYGAQTPSKGKYS